MSRLAPSVNRRALMLVHEVMGDQEKFCVQIEKGPLGCTIIDAGVNARGGYAAGRLVTEICLGGCGTASIIPMQYDNLTLPSIFVQTDFPAIATLGSQFAGWRIEADDYTAMGSGPARALCQKPKEVYELIQYKDHHDTAVIVLEAASPPTEKAVEIISRECEIKPRNLYAIVAPTSSIVGSVQISGRIVETGIHKLSQLGLDPKLITHGSGYAPIPPVHPQTAAAIGRTNDALYYGGVTFYTANVENDSLLKDIVSKTPSCNATVYGKPFHEILKEAKFDFYEVDPNIFAPAMITVNNTRTGTTIKSGKINAKALKHLMGIIET